MEAILDFGRGCQNLSIILRGGGEGGGGGRKWRAGQLLLLSHLKGEWEGGEEERGRSKHVLVLNACSFHSISLSYISVLLLQPLLIWKSSTGTIQTVKSILPVPGTVAFSFRPEPTICIASGQFSTGTIWEWKKDNVGTSPGPEKRDTIRYLNARVPVLYWDDEFQSAQQRLYTCVIGNICKIFHYYLNHIISVSEEWTLFSRLRITSLTGERGIVLSEFRTAGTGIQCCGSVTFWYGYGSGSDLATSCNNDSNLLLARITVCIEPCLPIGWHTFIWWKNPPKCSFILVWIGEWWDSLLTSRNPKNNWYLSRIFGTRFGEKDRGLSTCKPWTEQAGGLEAFLHPRQMKL